MKEMITAIAEEPCHQQILYPPCEELLLLALSLYKQYCKNKLRNWIDNDNN